MYKRVQFQYVISYFLNTGEVMNEYQKKYKEQSIMQLSQGELLILTFDEAIKCLKQADLALREKNYDKFNDFIALVQ